MNNSATTMVNQSGTTNSTNAPTPSPFDTGEVTWLLACISITWIMIPGVGFLYSGFARAKSSLSLPMLCLWTCATVSIQWYLLGCSLCLSSTGNFLIGNIDLAFLKGMPIDQPSSANPNVPLLLVSTWYCLFAVITPTIILGAVPERTRFLPTVIFIFIWSTIVFDFLTYWTWNTNGWTYQLGALDYGGGTPVHISTGAAALAIAYVVGKRKDCSSSETLPHSMTHVILGTCFIWLGWLVANAGSGLSPNLRAVYVFITTNLSAAAGGITWSVVDFIRYKERQWSAVGFCTGMIAGLVAITPASGYVSPTSSIIFGVIGAIACTLSTNVKKVLRVDDSFDVFCVHGIGGIVGNLLTGVFAEKSTIPGGEHGGGGLYDGNWKQVGIQGIDTLAGFSWSFVISFVLAWSIDKIPGLGFRASAEIEECGLDKAQVGVDMHEYIEELKVTALKGRGRRVPITLEGGAAMVGVEPIVSVSGPMTFGNGKNPAPTEISMSRL